MRTTGFLENLSAYTSLVAVSLVGAFCFLIGYRLLTGTINSKGLLSDKAGGGISPARVQLCLLSVSGAVYYLMMVVEAMQAGAVRATLPAPPKELLALILGSNTLYITAKAASVARQTSRLLFR